MTEIGGIFVLAGIPTLICAAAGAFHGRRATATRGKLLLGAFLVSGITCWSAFAVGDGGDMNFPVILPSWLVSTLGPFVGGPRALIYPPWWLSPWLAFAAYLIAAHVVSRGRASVGTGNLETTGNLLPIRLFAGAGVLLAASVSGLILQRNRYELNLDYLFFVLMFIAGIAITCFLVFARNKKLTWILFAMAGAYILYGLILFARLSHPIGGMN